MKFYKIIFLIYLLPVIATASEIDGNIDNLLNFDINDSSTYPIKHILGVFGNKVISEYAIGVVKHKKYNLKFLNFYTFPRNVTKEPVMLNFTVEFYDSKGNKLGEAKRISVKKIEPTNPNISPASTYGSNVKEADFLKVKKYKIRFTEI